MKFLAYYTLGYQRTYIEPLCLSVHSLRHFSPGIDIRILTDARFASEISSKIPDAQIITRPDASSPENASMQKLSVFNEDLSGYDVVIFIDSDILIGIPIESLLTKVTDDNKLYVFAEKLEQNAHTQLYWSLENYSRATLKYFADNNIFVFNAGLFAFRPTDAMKKHFQNVETMIANHRGKFFYEQSFMNVYFNTHNLADYTVFTNDNYTLQPERTAKHNIIAHFCGDPGFAQGKITRMSSYIDRYLTFLKDS